MELLLFWGAILGTLALGPLVLLGFGWSPFAALILYLAMARRGYKGVRYALRGGLYSMAFLIPWILAMLEDWNPEDTGFFTVLAFALLYAAWMMQLAFGLTFLGFGSDESYWYASYMKVWVPVAAIAWLSSLVWLIIAPPHTGAPDGLPRLHQVLPFAMFTVSAVLLLGPLYFEGQLEMNNQF